MQHVVWLETASQDLNEILGYIEDRNLLAALNLQESIEYAASQLPFHPYLYRLGRVPGTREMVVHPNFLVIYRVAVSAIEIINVLHASSNILHSAPYLYLQSSENENRTWQHQRLCRFGIGECRRNAGQGATSHQNRRDHQARKLTQVQAAELLGMTQPKLSNLLRGQFSGISEAKMLECLTRLGRNVEIVVKATGRSQSTGHVSVVFA